MQRFILHSGQRRQGPCEAYLEDRRHSPGQICLDYE
jgi:hypothetical protein